MTTIQRRYIGVSSGSSRSGIDAALVRVEGVGSDAKLHLEHAAQLPFGRDIRQLLARLDAGRDGLRALGVAHRVIGESFAGAVRQVLDETHASSTQVLAVGCDCPIMWHQPEGRYPASIHAGMTEIVAERSGLTVLSELASRDVALGGQGCPLSVPIDQRLFHDAGEDRVLVHLGGVAGVTWLPADLGPQRRHVSAFQAAPCTRVLDGMMSLLSGGRESCDPGGRYAVQGRCIDALLERWLQHPYLLRRPPKCVPGDEFRADFLEQAVAQARAEQHSLHDVLCTATHFVARALVQALHSFLPGAPTRVLLSGGGTRNGFLWRLLEAQLAPIPLARVDDHGVPATARKALACAGLAALTMDGLPGNVPAATGAAGPRLLGRFTPGASGNWARCLAWMAAQTAPLRQAA
jgi:anhydro-N-acetylmuramic acid kinase